MPELYNPLCIQDAHGLHVNTGVLVEDGLIVAMGPIAEMSSKHPGAQRVDWSNFAMIPGGINAHNHSFQSLLRGIATDEPFLTWRDQALYRYSPRLDAEALYAGALLAFGEMLSCGATTVADFFYIHAGHNDNDRAVIAAARDLGMRIVLARTMYDWSGAPENYRESVQQAVTNTRALALEFRGDPFVDVHPAPHSPHAASPAMIQAGHRLAQELDTPFHIHVAEEMFEVEETLRDHGLRPVHYLDRLGVVDERMIAIHLVWLEQEEIALLGSRRAGLAYCPSSNMFLADGVTRLPDLRRAGVRVGLGTDGACSNNRTSVFEEMRMAALLQKVSRLDATCIGAADTFAMGTADGADLLRLKTGRIAPGYAADFVGLDTGHLTLQPFAPELLRAHIVYGMQPDAIARVVIAGREIVRDGQILTVPQSRIRYLVDEAMRRIR